MAKVFLVSNEHTKAEIYREIFILRDVEDLSIFMPGARFRRAPLLVICNNQPLNFARSESWWRSVIDYAGLKMR